MSLPLRFGGIMGCDIHPYVEVKRNGTWTQVHEEIFPLSAWEQEYHKRTHTDTPFDWRSYGMFGFLADVRNYSRVPPLATPRGVPEDASKVDFYGSDSWDYHSASYLTAAELQAFDYTQTFEDRCTTKQTSPNCWDGAALADVGEGKMTTFQEFLGETFMEHVKALATLDPNPENVRVVFWFDN